MFELIVAIVNNNEGHSIMHIREKVYNNDVNKNKLPEKVLKVCNAEGYHGKTQYIASVFNKGNLCSQLMSEVYA